MRLIGNNAGNLLFQYAVTKLIGEPYDIVGLTTSWDPKRLRDQCRVLVVPSANFLRENFDFSHYVNFLESTGLPLVFVGLGAQADDFEKDTLDFHPSVLRLIDLIRERSELVAVRGEFTARVLERYGVTSHVVTGCPSNFTNPSTNLAGMIADKLARPMRSFITHADEPWPKKHYKAHVERRLAAWTLNGRSVMVQQSVPAMIRYLRLNNPVAEKDVPVQFEDGLRRALLSDCELEAFRDFLAVKLRTYYDVDQWMEDSAKFDFSVGLRLHGNMIAWQSGTPALWITHDSRTKELTDTMALPSIDVHEFIEKCKTVDEAWERVEFDSSIYSSRRLELYDKLKQVFHASGIAIRAV